VPAFGYRLLRFSPDEQQAAPDAPVPRHDVRTVQTTGWTLEVDAASGAIRTLANRKSGVMLFTGPAHLGLVVDDPTDTWSHGVDRFPINGMPLQCTAVMLVEQGPVRHVVEVCAAHGESRLSTAIVLPDDADLPVELRVTLDWREANRLLRLAYPIGAQRFEYEIPAGWIERPDDGREYPGQRWVRAVRSDHVVVIANDAKYSYAAKDGTLYMTAVRSPPFARHDPMTLPPELRYRCMDQGEQRFTIRVQAGPDLSRRDAWRLADALLRPPVVTPHVSRGGERPWHGRWLRAQTATSTLTAVKLAEDHDSLVLRGVELEGRPDRLIVEGGAVDIPARGMATALAGSDAVAASDGLERQL
jgi:alpha-mannosidase